MNIESNIELGTNFISDNKDQYSCEQSNDNGFKVSNSVSPIPIATTNNNTDLLYFPDIESDTLANNSVEDKIPDFSLDMVTADMDFEQVYSMYSNIQQKEALSAVDELKKLQMLNQQYVTTLPTQTEVIENSQYGVDQNEKFDFHRSQILGGIHNQGMKDSVGANDEPRSVGEGELEFDQFFSHTESNALEKFLDNLANPTNSDPLQFYVNYNAKGVNDVSQLYSMHTMKPSKPQERCVTSLKEELTEAFSHPHLNALSKSSTSSPSQVQLPTPADSRNNSSLLVKTKSTTLARYGEKLIYPTESTYSPPSSPRKRKRVSHKPLLTIEQKRLNHSSSEQKRRQLCKLAYERCLKLVVNVDEFHQESSKGKKSKRAKLSKEGLPNLSKHMALTKISSEIKSIKAKNDGLKMLLKEAGV